jgi:hypothetical protein
MECNTVHERSKDVRGNHAANKRAVKLTRELWGKLLFVILLLLIDIFGDNENSFLHSKIPNRDVDRLGGGRRLLEWNASTTTTANASIKRFLFITFNGQILKCT